MRLALVLTVMTYCIALGQQGQRDLRLEAPAKPRQVNTTVSNKPELREWPGSQKRWALIIGIDRYDDKQITALGAASNDAAALANALVENAGFPKDQVILLASNQAEERLPTRSNILLRLANLAKLVPRDGLLVFSFAGHGIERNGQAFLLPSDARVSDNIRVLQATALGLSEIKDWVQEMGVKQVVAFLDACRNDPTAGRGDVPNPLTQTFRHQFDFEKTNEQVEAFAIIYATRVGQRAYEYSEKKHGYFTWAILNGLRGAAANERGEVTLGSLEKYVQETVPKQIKIDLGSGRDQRPFADIKGYRASDLIIARINPRDIQLDKENAPAAVPDARLLQLTEWEAVKARGDVKALEAFRAKYPYGPFAEEAESRIDSLEWESAKASGTEEALQQYAARPKGMFREQALLIIQQLQSKRTTKSAIDDVLRRYQEAYGKRDAGLVHRLWPTLGKKEINRMREFFRVARLVKLQLTPKGEPVFQNDSATVVCQRQLLFVDERGSQRPISDSVSITLRKTGEDWLIESLQ